MLYTLRFFLFKMQFFFLHNANLFGSCIIYILYTGCAEIKKNNSGAKGLTKWKIIFNLLTLNEEINKKCVVEI